MAAKRKRTGVEWLGGAITMPAYITGEGEPYRPELLVWVSAEAEVLGSAMARPGELLGQACDSLQATIYRTMVGRADAPARVRVASPELAEVLRAGNPEIEIVCAPTPELDELFRSMLETIEARADTERSYLSPGIGPAAVAGFFRAAAELFRSKPWETVPDDQSLFALTIEKLDVKDVALSVIGQTGQSLGFLLFSGVDDFEAYLDAADAIERGEEPAMPPTFVLNFERGAELSATQRREIAEHGWEVAGEEAYPWLVVVDEDLVARRPTAEEVAIAEAVARALPRVFEDETALLAAWSGGESVARTLSVPTHLGEVEVSLRAPYEQEPTAREATARETTARETTGRRPLPASVNRPAVNLPSGWSRSAGARPADNAVARTKKRNQRKAARKARRKTR